VDYKFKLPKTHPETHHQNLQAIHIDLKTSKPMFNKTYLEVTRLEATNLRLVALLAYLR